MRNRSGCTNVTSVFKSNRRKGHFGSVRKRKKHNEVIRLKTTFQTGISWITFCVYNCLAPIYQHANINIAERNVFSATQHKPQHQSAGTKQFNSFQSGLQS